MNMSLDEGLRLHAELKSIFGESPGALYGIEDRLRKISFAFGLCTGVTVYFREKVSSAIHWVGLWRTERQWREWGDDSSRLRAIVHQSLCAMERVITQELTASDAPAPRGA